MHGNIKSSWCSQGYNYGNISTSTIHLPVLEDQICMQDKCSNLLDLRIPKKALNSE